MSIIDTLARDHRVIETIIAELSTTPSHEAEQRLRLFSQLQSLLQAHERAEEEVVYRPLCARLPTEVKPLEAYEEHHIADLLLQELAADCPGGPGWTAKARVFEEVVRHHIKEEELLIFPLLMDNFDEAALNRMDSDFQLVKHERIETMFGPLRRATPAFAGRATVTAQAAAGRYVRRGELFLRRRLAGSRAA